MPFDRSKGDMMTISRRAFLRTGAILPAAALVESLAEHRVEAEERHGGGDDERSRSAHETSGFATVNGQHLYYVTLGRGTPVIFLHGGLGFDHEYFRPFVDPLAEIGRASCRERVEILVDGIEVRKKVNV